VPLLEKEKNQRRIKETEHCNVLAKLRTIILMVCWSWPMFWSPPLMPEVWKGMRKESVVSPRLTRLRLEKGIDD